MYIYDTTAIDNTKFKKRKRYIKINMYNSRTYK